MVHIQSEWRPAMSRARTRSFLAAMVFSLLVCQSPCSQAQGKPAPSTPPSSEANPERIAAEGQRALASGQYPVAERDYNQLLKLGVHTASLYSNLGVVYMRTGRFA